MAKKKAPKKRKGYVMGGTIKDYVAPNAINPFANDKTDFMSYAKDAGRLAIDAYASQYGGQDLIKGKNYNTALGRKLHGDVDVAAPVVQGIGDAALNYLAPGAGTAMQGVQGIAGQVIGQDDTLTGKQKSQMNTASALAVKGNALLSTTGISKSNPKGVFGGMGNNSTQPPVGTIAGTSTGGNAVSMKPFNSSSFDVSVLQSNPKALADYNNAQDDATKAQVLNNYGINYADGGKIKKADTNKLWNPSLAKNDKPFQEWYSKNTLEGQRGEPISDKQDYDMYSYFKNTPKSELSNPNAHFPDLYKRPNHETFSNESLYSIPENTGGSWNGDQFIPMQGKADGGKINKYVTPLANLNNFYPPDSTTKLPVAEKDTIKNLPLYNPLSISNPSETVNAMNPITTQVRKKGGKIVGKGGPKEDAIKMEAHEGGFVVPAINAPIAEHLREQFLGDSKAQKAPLKEGDTDVKVSDGEHYFTPEEVTILTQKGVDLNKLAPDAKPSNKLAKGGTPLGKDQLDALKQQLLNGKISQEEFDAKVKLGGTANIDATTATANARKAQQPEKDKNNLLDQINTAKNQASVYKNRGLIDYYKKANDNAKALQAQYDKQYGNTSNTPASKSIKQTDKPIPGQVDTSGIANKQVTGRNGGIAKKIAANTAQTYATTPARTESVRVGNNTPVSANKSANTATQRSTTPNGAGIKESIARQPMETMSARATPDFTKTVNPKTGQPYTASELANDVNAAKTSIPTAGTTTTSQNPPVNTPTSPNGTNKQFDWGKGLAIAQTGLGIGSLINDGTAPVYTIDPALIADQQQAKENAQFGYNPSNINNVKRDIELNRRMQNKQVQGLSGGSAGTQLANQGAATQEANASLSNLAADSENFRLQKQQQSYGLDQAVSQKRDMAFNQKMNLFQLRQGTGAQLTNAGIENLVGSQRYADALKAKDKRDNTANATTSGLATLTPADIQAQYDLQHPTTKAKYPNATSWYNATYNQ